MFPYMFGLGVICVSIGAFLTRRYDKYKEKKSKNTNAIDSHTKIQEDNKNN